MSEANLQKSETQSLVVAFDNRDTRPSRPVCSSKRTDAVNGNIHYFPIYLDHCVQSDLYQHYHA